ncbi:MAG: redoxin domain-containing protein [Aliarcobacter sp.]|nr:redoxin domain-containing protein [Aliarcobacter sp.]
MRIVKIFFLFVILKEVVFATSFSFESLEKNRINVVAFVTLWCPVCIKTNDYLLSLAKNNSEISVTLFFVDEDIPSSIIQTANLKLISISLNDSKEFGVTQSVPYILVFDKKSELVKKYNTFNEAFISRLINNLKNDLYENGTLPPEQRIDLWQKNRF